MKKIYKTIVCSAVLSGVLGTLCSCEPDGPFYTFDSNEISNVVTEGELSLAGTDLDINYLLIDENGIVGYTAAYIASGYGTKLKCYISELYNETITNCVKPGKVEIPEGFTAYVINQTEYAKFVNSVSNNVISLEDAMNPDSNGIKTWNSKENTYLTDNLKIRFTKGDDTMKTKNTDAFRLSSVFDNFDGSGKASYLMEAPYTDSYKIACEDASSLVVKNESDETIKSTNNLYSFSKGQKIIVELEGEANKNFNLAVNAVENEIVMPYEVNELKDVSEYDVQGSSTADPLKACELSVTKRDDGKGLYVNCNNPEALHEDCLNTVLTGQEVTDKKVFFTFEHNNVSTKDFYYAYRVTNDGDEDVFITVTNMGYQVGGDGNWLGEDEWTQFYNLPFRVDDKNYTASQRKNYVAYLGFCNTYEPHKYQPITYRIPKGKYIYVMGGTTKDAYKNINVFDTANIAVNANKTGCSNGAVLFNVTGGKAYGQFMAYTDVDASTINETEYVKEKKQYGYAIYVMTSEGSKKKVGLQYSGYDTCHGVVDTNLEWVFNDKTPKGALPVNYTNSLYGAKTRGDAYSEVTGTTPKVWENASGWVTHINPCGSAEAVGTDMTRYITTDHFTGEDIVIEPGRYDGLGGQANIGNWMVDYIDTFTLVNQGNRARKFKYKMVENGVMCAFIRNSNGRPDNSTYSYTYQVVLADSQYGDKIDQPFEYEIEVPAHSVVRFSVDYNLVANACGYITHAPTLED